MFYYTLMGTITKYRCSRCGDFVRGSSSECCVSDPLERWECGECGRTYDSEYDAKKCCASETEECYFCEECGHEVDDEWDDCPNCTEDEDEDEDEYDSEEDAILGACLTNGTN